MVICSASLSEWLISNKLVLNEKKTKAVILRSQGKMIPPIQNTLNIVGKTIEIVKKQNFSWYQF